ncbi:MAG: PD-(D/E)XK nuclease family protein, partial [Bryobacteraceae bacterium]|nr:PD-(D/E)XK nuclease family protein [Bryobacteraceae bacterium]
EFVFFLEEMVLRGQIDLWFEEGGTSVLVDYKTDRFDEDRVDGYSLQLRLYALALERMKGRLPDEAWLYFLRPDRAVRVSLDAEALAEACNAVREFREAQERLDFPLRAGKHCYQCEFYRGICPR